MTSEASKMKQSGVLRKGQWVWADLSPTREIRSLDGGWAYLAKDDESTNPVFYDSKGNRNSLNLENDIDWSRGVHNTKPDVNRPQDDPRYGIFWQNAPEDAQYWADAENDGGYEASFWKQEDGDWFWWDGGEWVYSLSGGTSAELIPRPDTQPQGETLTKAQALREVAQGYEDGDENPWARIQWRDSEYNWHSVTSCRSLDTVLSDGDPLRRKSRTYRVEGEIGEKTFTCLEKFLEPYYNATEEQSMAKEILSLVQEEK